MKSGCTNSVSAALVDDLPDTDAAVAYFVSGYIGRSVSALRKCGACKNMLVFNDCTPAIQTDIPEKLKVIFARANRGGLSEPTEFCFAVTIVAVRCYTTLSGNGDMMKKLLQTSNQRRVFITAVRKMVETSALLNGLLNVECTSSEKHKNFDLVIQASFNCFAVNELKRLNSKPVAEEIPAKTLRKIRKLTSKGSSTKQSTPVELKFELSLVSNHAILLRAHQLFILDVLTAMYVIKIVVLSIPHFNASLCLICCFWPCD